jgi:hypothetical protein
MKEERIALLGQLYFELRSYRLKEFQTFIFAFPIIGRTKWGQILTSDIKLMWQPYKRLLKCW